MSIIKDRAETRRGMPVVIQISWSKAEGDNNEKSEWNKAGVPLMIQTVWSKAKGVTNKKSGWNKAGDAGNATNRLK